MSFSGDIFKSSHTLHFLALGLVLGLMAGMFPGPAAVMLISALFLLYAQRASQRSSDPWFFRLLAAGLGLRLLIISLLAVLSTLKGDIVAIFGDSKFNFDVSRSALMYYTGIADISSVPSALFHGFYGYNFFNWIYGAFYYLFGYSPLLLRFVNSLSGCLVAWMVYLITRRICENKTVAAWAMAFCLFWPSLILWSITLLKEPGLALYVSLVIYLFVELIKRKRWWFLVPVCLLWYPMKEIRVNSHYLMLLTISLSLIFFLPRRKAHGLLLAALLAGAGLEAGYSRIRPLYQEFQNMVIAAQMGYITTGGSYYKFIPERFQPRNISSEIITPGEMTISFCKALYYYLCVPNPFTQIKASQAPVAPQMVIWYALLLFCFPAGVLHLVRHHYRESGIILVYILVFISALAIFTGNEGAAFRQRDMVIPFFFIPMSVGLFNLLGWLAVKVKHRVEPVRPVAESAGDDRAGY